MQILKQQTVIRKGTHNFRSVSMDFLKSLTLTFNLGDRHNILRVVFPYFQDFFQTGGELIMKFTLFCWTLE